MEEETKLLLYVASKSTSVEMAKIIKSTKREIVFIRQVVQYFLKHHTKFSLEKIGEETGGCDHATIIYSVNTIQGFLDIEDKKTVDLYRCFYDSIKDFLIDNILVVPYKIEKHVPIPNLIPSNKKYPFDKMGVGDSFVGMDEYNEKRYKRFFSAASKYGKRNNKKFTIRTTPEGVRVWRVA